MPITVKNVKNMFGKDVFTDKGYYCGRVSDLEFDLSRFKIRSLVIEAAKGSVIDKMVGGKKGIIVPYPMVESIGDVVLIKHIVKPIESETETETERAA